MAQGAHSTAQEAPKRAPRGTQAGKANWHLEPSPPKTVSETASRPPTGLPEAPRRLPEALTRLQEAPGCPREAPKRLQKVPKRPPISLQEAPQRYPKRTQEESNAPLTHAPGTWREPLAELRWGRAPSSVALQIPCNCCLPKRGSCVSPRPPPTTFSAPASKQASASDEAQNQRSQQTHMNKSESEYD